MATATKADFSRLARVGCAVDEGTKYAVAAGDTLAQIVRRFHGDPDAWHRIHAANRDRLTDPDYNQPGHMLKIPAQPLIHPDPNARRQPMKINRNLYRPLLVVATLAATLALAACNQGNDTTAPTDVPPPAATAMPPATAPDTMPPADSGSMYTPPDTMPAPASSGTTGTPLH